MMETLDQYTKTIINDMVITLYKEDHKQKFITCMYELNYSLQSSLYSQGVFRRVKQMRGIQQRDDYRVTWINPKTFGVVAPLNVNPKKHISNFKYEYGDPTDNLPMFQPVVNSRDMYLCWQHSLDTYIVELFPLPSKNK